jgi:surface antigen
MHKYVAASFGVMFMAAGCTAVDFGGNVPTEPATEGLVTSSAPPQDSAILFSVTGASIAKFMNDRAATMLDRRDRDSVGLAADRSFRSGDIAEWENAETGNSGRIDPGPTYRRTTGRLCRQYTHTFWRDKEKRRDNGTACQLEDGSWEVIG